MEKMQDISLIWVAFSLGALIIMYPLNALRLNYILSVDKISASNYLGVLSIVWASSFLSLAVPSSAFSDGIKAALLRTTRISNLSLAVRSVIIDRFIGLIYTLGLAGVLLLVPNANINPVISKYWGLVFLLCFICIVLLLFLGSNLVNRIKFFVKLRALFNGTRNAINNSSAIVSFLGFAVMNVIISAFSLWCLARGLSVNISFWIFFLLTPAILIVNNLPFFYQGFGGREAALLYAFSNYSPSMSPDLLVTISLLSGGVMMISALFGSIFIPFITLRKNNLLMTKVDNSPQNILKVDMK